VKAKVLDAIRRIKACGKPAGVLTGDAAFAAECMRAGTTFTAVGVDAAILARSTEALVQAFRNK
jgi:4-hydroxy-2-oxoheptanedioate aldolase